MMMEAVKRHWKTTNTIKGANVGKISGGRTQTKNLIMVEFVYSHSILINEIVQPHIARQSK